MNRDSIKDLLLKYKNDELSEDDMLKNIEELPYSDLDYAKIDHHREIRNGYPEVIYSEGKAIKHIVGIVENMLSKGEENILLTRVNAEIYDALQSITKNLDYFEEARIIIVNPKVKATTDTSILVLAAGTADYPVAEEAAITAEVFGNRVERLYDVGVAGIHRLLSKIDVLNSAKVIICVAGMEGALLSVVGGLVDVPLIGVPTSVGYGANFGGLAALLAMLNSCASGSSVVNIDNGFGAGYLASMINKQGGIK
ncbi:MAG: nickel pincer cofactor biosynthesis protein LarB [Tissierellia bacterium]|nr:nickel pincer cofactor biosynthesis protein LarB [Tissierellia bacterium]